MFTALASTVTLTASVYCIASTRVIVVCSLRVLSTYLLTLGVHASRVQPAKWGGRSSWPITLGTQPRALPMAAYRHVHVRARVCTRPSAHAYTQRSHTRVIVRHAPASACAPLLARHLEWRVSDTRAAMVVIRTPLLIDFCTLRSTHCAHVRPRFPTATNHLKITARTAPHGTLLAGGMAPLDITRSAYCHFFSRRWIAVTCIPVAPIPLARVSASAKTQCLDADGGATHEEASAHREGGGPSNKRNLRATQPVPTDGRDWPGRRALIANFVLARNLRETARL